MKFKTWFCFLVFLLFSSSMAIGQDSKIIEDAFWNYVAATAESDGQKVSGFFSNYAFAYWDRLLKQAKELNRDELLKRPTYQVFSTLFLRQRMSEHPAIMNMNGREFIILSYSKGWNSQQTLSLLHSQREMFSIIPEVNGDSATLSIKYQDTVLPNPIVFIKEEGQWRIDGRNQFEKLEKGTEDKRKEAGLSKPDFCEMIFKTAMGKPLPDELWEPVKGQ